MRRWFLSLLCIVLGGLIVLLGWLVPMHLRAVDSRLLQKAGKSTPSLADRATALLADKRLGAAEILYQAAQTLSLPETASLGTSITNTAFQHPSWVIWGGGESELDVLFKTDPKLPKTNSEPFTEWVIRLDNRGTALRLFSTSAKPLVQEFLNSRGMTNTTVLPPSQSDSGQAFDAAVSICAMLAEENRFSPGLSNAFYTLVYQANRAGNPQPYEEVLMDFISLGQRMNWGQLVVFVTHIEDTETLHQLAYVIRRNDTRIPIIYAAVDLSGQPAAISHYLTRFGQAGINDLGQALRYHQGGLNELLRRDQALYAASQGTEALRSGLLKPFFDFSLERAHETPEFAIAFKWALYVFGGFLIAGVARLLRPRVSELERPLQVGGLHFARETLFGLGFLLVILLVTEPFLSQESQRMERPIRFRLQIPGAAIAKTTAPEKQVFMNQKNLLTLLLFFVLQALLYIACLVKLAEIRRQKVPARIKLRLLENEEHLFDAGLYLGFAGTIISLILVSLNVIAPSLMAAYGSTSFGIIFVSIFKIFHLRPMRRRILLESETSSDTSMLVRHVHSTP
jgi:hypothetical protein